MLCSACNFNRNKPLATRPLSFSSSIACKKRSKLPSWKLCKAGIRMGAPLARCDL